MPRRFSVPDSDPSCIGNRFEVHCGFETNRGISSNFKLDQDLDITSQAAQSNVESVAMDVDDKY
jgi:hypothetical protein